MTRGSKPSAATDALISLHALQKRLLHDLSFDHLQLIVVG
jgi:hypothetical protein